MVSGVPSRASVWRQWSAWLPLAIPVFLFLLGVRHAVLYGFTRDVDEGTEAHLFQLLMPLQLLAMGYFALSWLPRARAAWLILGLQIAATATLLIALYWAEHQG